MLGMILLAAIPLAAAPFMGVGGLALPPADAVEQFADTLTAAGLNHIQCAIPTNEADVRTRVKYLQGRGITVYGTSTAFVEIRGEREDYQIKADGTEKTGTVCPRSARRIGEMIERTKSIQDTGADGMFWDFITVESRTMEACFCPACVAALNKAAGTEFSREELVEALGKDAGLLKTWVQVRGDSTTEALRQVVEAAHAHRPDFQVGGYVISPGNDLGMDTDGMSHVLDILGPMAYQGRGRAPLGWMRRALAGFSALSGDAKIIECIDTGFWVDEPVDELINTCWDCHRAEIDGWALWPYSPISAEELAGVAVVPRLAETFHAPLAAGDHTRAVEGLTAVLAEAKQKVLQFGSDAARLELDTLYPERDDTSPIGQALKAPDALNSDDKLAGPVARLLHLRADAVGREMHASDRQFHAGEYTVTFSDVAQTVEVRTSEWTARHNDLALNIDELVFADQVGNASSDPYNLGLLRTRVNGWFDPWGAKAALDVQQADANTVVIDAACTRDNCRLGRTWTITGGERWMQVDVFVENVGDEKGAGRLWIWNGLGIPGFLEGNGTKPWQDDKARLLDNNILVTTDEDHFVAIGTDPDGELLKLPTRGMNHLFYDVDLAPGERYVVRFYLAFGSHYADQWAEVLDKYPGGKIRRKEISDQDGDQ